MDSELITNSAHGAGLTCLAFSRDGVHAFTGGQDTIVRIWKVADGSQREPATAADADKHVTSISLSDDCWVAGSIDSNVRRYANFSNQLDSHVTNLAGSHIRCVAIDPTGKTVAVASDEADVRLVDMNDNIKIKVLRGHRRGVRRVTWHPKDAILTSCGSDGRIIVWDLSQDDPKTQTTIEGTIPTVLEPTDQEFLHDCSAIWHPSGDYFFVPSRAHDIAVVHRRDWKKTHTFTKDTPGAITALALSINGAYLAAASATKVHIWSTQTRQSITSHSLAPKTIITQLAFSPTQNLIAWTDADGVFTRWSNPLPKPHDPVQKISEPAPVDEAPALLFDDNKEEVVDDAGDVDLDNASDADDWVGYDPDLMDDPILGDTGGNFVKEMVSITKAQPPFQPGATPMVDRKQYLAFSMIGVIEVTDVSEQGGHHVVNVEFFDRSTRKSYHFKDHFKYHLGYLGERGALFACRPETDHPAQVLYKPYGNYTGEIDWTYTLNRTGCAVLGIAAGGTSPSGSMRQSSDGDLEGFGNVIIATNEGDLTFLSGTGRERRIMGLGADFVSMVAGPEWVFVVHRAGATTIDGSQNLSYTLINFDDFSVRQRDVLPVPKGHTLKWIGITDEGAPAMYDTTGRVHILTKFRIPHHASWARVMDTNLLERRKGKDESYWPIGINGNTFVCLILKGTQEYPGFPKPLPQDLPMQLPFRSSEEKDEMVEREMLALEISRDALDDELTSQDIITREKAVDKEMVLLIQEACKANNVPRAIELAKLIHHPKVYDVIIKVSEFYHLVGLTEKIQALKSIREESEDRLVLARNKRQQWTRPDPPLRRLPTVTDSVPSRPKAFQDFGPPPAVSRPGLAPAKPVKETTRYTANTTFDVPLTPVEASSTSPPESKRKRSEVDDDIPSSLDFDAPPPKQKINPFARKIGQDNGRNPFGRKAELNKTLQKSESFFDKVDAAEGDAPKPKRPPALKPKDKSGPRQTTLFGLMSSAPSEKKSQVDKKSSDKETSTQSSVAETDVAMTDSSLIETQPELPEEWEETQPVDVETQPVTP
ncbi:hypothetical protein C8J57DRAFT_1284265 [Mycena rebaudengoi]|nr:hypothetical protein C8J57DRAFT_1284265 [Mycena rebaudengoi]